MKVDLQAFRVALQLAGIQCSEEVVFVIGHVYETIKEKGKKVTLEDIEATKELARKSYSTSK